MRRVFAATHAEPGVAPAAQVMLNILTHRAREFVALGEE